jgi:hypothetical protein
MLYAAIENLHGVIDPMFPSFEGYELNLSHKSKCGTFWLLIHTCYIPREALSFKMVDQLLFTATRLCLGKPKPNKPGKLRPITKPAKVDR